MDTNKLNQLRRIIREEMKKADSAEEITKKLKALAPGETAKIKWIGGEEKKHSNSYEKGYATGYNGDSEEENPYDKNKQPNKYKNWLCGHEKGYNDYDDEINANLDEDDIEDDED